MSLVYQLPSLSNLFISRLCRAFLNSEFYNSTEIGYFSELNDRIFFQSGKEDEELFNDLSEHELGSSQTLKCSHLLTMILARSWSAAHGGVASSSKQSLKHVLSWPLWSCYFRRFGKIVILCLVKQRYIAPPQAIVFVKFSPNRFPSFLSKLETRKIYFTFLYMKAVGYIVPST